MRRIDSKEVNSIHRIKYLLPTYWCNNGIHYINNALLHQDVGRSSFIDSIIIIRKNNLSNFWGLFSIHNFINQKPNYQQQKKHAHKKLTTNYKPILIKIKSPCIYCSFNWNFKIINRTSDSILVRILWKINTIHN